MQRGKKNRLRIATVAVNHRIAYIVRHKRFRPVNCILYKKLRQEHLASEVLVVYDISQEKFC